MQKYVDKKPFMQNLSLHETIAIKMNNLLYKAIPASTLATVLIAAMLVGVLLPFFDNRLLILWLVVVVAVNAARYVLYRFYFKQKSRVHNADFWDKYFYFLLIVNGLCFSIVGIAFLPDTVSSHHYFPIMVLIGLAAGSVSSLSFNLRNITTYFLLLLVPVIIAEVIINTSLSYSIAGLVLLSMIFLLMNAKRIYQTSIENITLNYQLEKHSKELIESRNAAIEANSEKTNFISMISHELRTPLNGMMGYAQLLKMSETPALNPEQLEKNNGIIESGKHLLSLVEELLDLSSIESNKLKLDIKDVSLNDILESSLGLLTPVAMQHHIEVIKKIDGVYLVKADAKKLKQVFINLISNAIKYNRENGKIIIEIKKVMPEKIKISVSDTGDGLTKEQINGLFQPFHRFNKRKEGLGLGLYISQNIIGLMNGKIGVESVVGEGSTFWFEVTFKDN